jgi:hypothetical protein
VTDDWSAELEGFYGVSRISLPSIGGATAYDLKLPVLWGGNAILRDDRWIFRLSGLNGRIGNQIPGLAQVTSALDGVASLVPEADTAADALNLKTAVHFYSAGLGYDDGTWTGQSEYGLTKCDCQLVRGNNAAYAMLGRHFGEWMPFLSYSKVWQSERALSFSTPVPVPQIQELFAATDQILQSSALEQDDRAVGLRWNVTGQTDVKVQYDNYHVHNFSTLWRPQTDRPAEKSGVVNIFSASIDFIF